MQSRLNAPIKKLPIDLTRVETTKGTWLIAVDSVAETIAGNTLLIGLILEQSIDDSSFQMKRLEAMVDSNVAREPENCGELLDRIRTWIETNEDDGFLDLCKATY